MMPAQETFLPYRHIVGLSGGKDSCAMALRLAEVEPRDYEYICTPTGDELPEMVEQRRDRLIFEVAHRWFDVRGDPMRLEAGGRIQ